jgi:hypothetical protein
MAPATTVVGESAMARHFATVACDRPRVGPENLPGAIGILADADNPGEIVGIAFGAGHVGGWRWDWGRPGSEPEDLGPREATWRLVVGKVEVEGRIVLRAGEFVELAEDTL